VIKNFSFPQNQNVVRADVFRQVLWQFLSVRLRRIFGFSRGVSLAAAGGEMRSDYFNNTAHKEYWGFPRSGIPLCGTFPSRDTMGVRLPRSSAKGGYCEDSLLTKTLASVGSRGYQLEITA
jgi:hypothetical protein